MSARASPSNRIWPKQGLKLDISVIRGQWAPSGFVDCAGVFAVTWRTPSGRNFWAALHDFDDFTQRHLIAECARHDRGAAA